MTLTAISRAARAAARSVFQKRAAKEDSAPPPPSNDNALSLVFTHEQAGEYATIALEGQYLLAAYLVNAALAPSRSDTALLVDFGCGAGKSTRAIASSVRPGGRILGVDISDQMLAQARAMTAPIGPRSGAAFDYRKINAVFGRETIPLDDKAADAVSTTIVLQEFQSEELLRNAITEIGRIARPGARLAAACVSDLITTQDYTTFTYAPFPDNATRPDNVRKCQSTVSRIVWENDRHWSKGVLVDAFRKAGWTDIKATYPLAPKELRPFPTRPEIDWKDETRAAPLLLITATKG